MLRINITTQAEVEYFINALQNKQYTHSEINQMILNVLPKEDLVFPNMNELIESVKDYPTILPVLSRVLIAEHRVSFDNEDVYENNIVTFDSLRATHIKVVSKTGQQRVNLLGVTQASALFIDGAILNIKYYVGSIYLTDTLAKETKNQKHKICSVTLRDGGIIYATFGKVDIKAGFNTKVSISETLMPSNFILKDNATVNVFGEGHNIICDGVNVLYALYPSTISVAETNPNMVLVYNYFGRAKENKYNELDGDKIFEISVKPVSQDRPQKDRLPDSETTNDDFLNIISGNEDLLWEW